jgi:hypothetical protein
MRRVVKRLAVVSLAVFSAVVLQVTTGASGTTAMGSSLVGVWHGETILVPSTPAVPVTATFHGDGSFTISTITEVQPNPVLPGAKTPVQGVWQVQGSRFRGVGVWFDEGTGGADPPAVGRVVFWVRFDGDRDHLAGQASIELLACTDLTSCPDPTVGIPDPPSLPSDTFSLSRLSG